jgi:hypothetical protein
MKFVNPFGQSTLRHGSVLRDIRIGKNDLIHTSSASTAGTSEQTERSNSLVGVPRVLVDPRLHNVGEGGLEPPRPYEHWHLKPARLPFRHSPE